MALAKGHPEDLEVAVETANLEDLEMLEVLHHLKVIMAEVETQELKAVAVAEQVELEITLVIMEVLAVVEQQQI